MCTLDSICDMNIATVKYHPEICRRLAHSVATRGSDLSLPQRNFERARLNYYSLGYIDNAQPHKLDYCSGLTSESCLQVYCIENGSSLLE